MKKLSLLTSIIVTIMLATTVPASASDLTATYTNLGVPTNVDTSFKTYMDWRAVTNKTSRQYKYINKNGWGDEQGFMRANGDSDLGISEDYYLIALGSYYGTKIGTKYRITTDTGTETVIATSCRTVFFTAIKVHIFFMENPHTLKAV